MRRFYCPGEPQHNHRTENNDEFMSRFCCCTTSQLTHRLVQKGVIGFSRHGATIIPVKLWALLLCLLWTLPSSWVWDLRRRKTARPSTSPYLSAAPQLVEFVKSWRRYEPSRATDQQPHIYAHPLTNCLTGCVSVCQSVGAGGRNDKLPSARGRNSRIQGHSPHQPADLLPGCRDGWLWTLFAACSGFLLNGSVNAWAAIKNLYQ